MKRRVTALVLNLALLGSSLPALSQGHASNRAPVIKHTPITLAAPGQSITIRARVTDDAAKVKAVTLFYATSRDAAPFRTPMSSAGQDSFLGTIPATQLAGISNVSYYIEATDGLDAAAETPWYSVQFQGQTATSTVAGAGAAGEKWSWKKKALVGGAGAAAVLGGVAMAAGGGGGGGGGSADNTGTNAGTYAGSVMTSLELDGSAPTTTTHAVTFTVFSAGLVSSDTLKAGQHLEAPIAGGTFEMVANVTESGLTGTIRYIGHLINNRIVGNIDGTARTSGGVPGTFSGTFSAVKQ